MLLTELTSIAGLTIQGAGIVLIAVLSFFIRQSISRKSLDYWTAAWVCLSIALLALIVVFYLPSLSRILYPIYFLGEYAFGLMFIAGCRNRASGWTVSRRHMRFLLPAVLGAFVIPWLTTDFNKLFIFHAGVVAGLFGWAFYSLQPARVRGQSSPGLKVMSIALLLLTLDFSSYFA